MFGITKELTRSHKEMIMWVSKNPTLELSYTLASPLISLISKACENIYTIRPKATYYLKAIAKYDVDTIFSNKTLYKSNVLTFSSTYLETLRWIYGEVQLNPTSILPLELVVIQEIALFHEVDYETIKNNYLRLSSISKGYVERNVGAKVGDPLFDSFVTSLSHDSNIALLFELDLTPGEISDILTETCNSLTESDIELIHSRFIWKQTNALNASLDNFTLAEEFKHKLEIAYN